MSDNSVYRHFPYSVAHLWHIYNRNPNPRASEGFTRFITPSGDEILDTISEIEDWLSENVGDRYTFSNGRLMSDVYYGKEHPARVSNCIHFSDELDVLAFRLRWGML